MGLIREILMDLESKQPNEFLDHDDPVVAYHASLLREAGFVNGVIINNELSLPRACRLAYLTWRGHDFLDAMRDESIWRKAQESILKPAGGIAFDVLFQWLKVQMQQKLGLPVV